jgi:hypothetical protein
MDPEQVNKWRIVPRLMLCLYAYICLDTHIWFMSLEAPTTQQQIYASVIWGAAAAWFGFYVNTGNKHD